MRIRGGATFMYILQLVSKNHATSFQTPESKAANKSQWRARHRVTQLTSAGREV